MIEIKDRTLQGVSLINWEINWREDGVQYIGATCQVTLSDMNGGDDGPFANVILAVPAESSAPVRDVSRAILARLHEVLVRMSEFSVAELETSFEQHQKRVAEDRKKSAAFGAPRTEPA